MNGSANIYKCPKFRSVNSYRARQPVVLFFSLSPLCARKYNKYLAAEMVYSFTFL